MTKVSQVLKCNSCNIVIDEVLCFVQNRHEVMDVDGLVQLSTSAFSKEDIVKAKSLLFQAVPTTLRKIQRKQEGKLKRDMEDIITVFKNTRVDKIPMFVAHDLNKLPPITFDHVDCSRLLKDLLVLRADIDNIKDTYVTKEQLAREKNVQSLCSCEMGSAQNNIFSPSLSRPNDVFVNMRRGGSRQVDMYNDSGPISLLHIPEKSLTSEQLESTVEERTLKELRSKPQLTLSPTRSDDRLAIPLAPEEQTRLVEARKECTEVSNTKPDAPALNSASGTTVSISDIICKPLNRMTSLERAHDSTSLTSKNISVKTFSSVLQQEGEWKVTSQQDKGWTQVQRNRFKNRFIGSKGTAATSTNCKFRAADIKVPLYVYNIDKSVLPNDIEEYIESKTRVNVTAEKMEVRKEKSYLAYKIYVPQQKLSIFLDGGLWPEGISFRRFIEFKSRNIKTQTVYKVNSILNGSK